MADKTPRELVQDLIQAALAAADPAQAVARHVCLEGDTLHVGDRAYDIAGRRVVVLGAGKASGTMAAAVEELLGERIATGWVNVRRGYEPAVPLRRIHIHGAGHPIPDLASLEGTQQMLERLAGLSERDLVLFLLSGGASALLELPVAGVSLEDLQRLTDALLRSGAAIAEINTVRKHLSQVKGGRLVHWAGPAQVAVLVLSDVVGSPLDAIGSGPWAPDPTSFADAWAVLQRYGLLDGIPAGLREHLERGRRGEVGDTPKPGDPRLAQVQHLVVADNRAAASAAVARARALGYHALLLTTSLEGEAREVGRVFAALAKEVACYDEPLPRPAVLVLGGETTVTVRGQGQGGRNQEAALAAALALEGWAGVMVATLATDGTDGPTDAAGAIVTGETVARARALGLDPGAHLARNDAYPFFAVLGDLVQTGPTGTNVNDLAFVVVGR
jgi:hydroxypyruvate reductase